MLLIKLLCIALHVTHDPSSHEPLWRSISAKFGLKCSQQVAMWNTVPEDVDTLMKIAVSIEDPELRVELNLLS